MSEEKTLEELADELALGLLTEEEAAVAEARLGVDPEFRAAVAASRDRLLELDMTAEPAPLDDKLWSKVEARLASTGEERQSKPKARPANDNASPWRSRAIASAAAAALLAIALSWSLLSRPAPEVVAVLLDAEGTPVAIVEDFAGPKARIVALRDFAPPADRAIQLWTKPLGAERPVSLGLLPKEGSGTLPGAALGAAREGQLYEISLEQAGGSPTGLPTGPILGKGFAAAPR